MFYLLSKTVPYLIMPLSIIIISLLVALFVKNRKWKHRLSLFAIVCLLFFSNQLIISNTIKLWEIPATPIDQLANTDKIGIVLTGVVKKEKLPHDRVYFAEGADRVTHAIQLYKKGKISKILISGGTGSFSKSMIREADQLRQVFLMCDVPSEDLIIENQSRNTRESAVAVAEILNSNFPNSEFLLITSAFHMRRSVGCFKKVGIKVQAFSTDFKSSDYPPKFTSFFIPSTGAINTWHILFREWIGMAAYRFMGYL